MQLTIITHSGCLLLALNLFHSTKTGTRMITNRQKNTTRIITTNPTPAPIIVCSSLLCAVTGSVNVSAVISCSMPSPHSGSPKDEIIKLHMLSKFKSTPATCTDGPVDSHKDICSAKSTDPFGASRFVRYVTALSADS